MSRWFGLFAAFKYFLGAVLLAGLMSSVAHAGAKPDTLKLKRHKINISARPVSFAKGNEDIKVFGDLVYRNGFVLTSSSPFWGGLSGITISKQGAHVAMVSDAGFWARMELSYAQNRLRPPASALIGPLRALGDKPLKRDKDRDAEAITLVKGSKFFSEALISFEDNHRIGRFQLKKDGIKGPKAYLKLPSITSRLRGNAGLEAMAVLRSGALKGSLVAIAQSRKDKRGNFIGWLVRKGKISKIRFTPPPLDTYRITDAASLPNGDLLLLERRYKFLTVNIRVRYVRQKELRSGLPIKGRVLLRANSNKHRVDNMEGIAVHTNKLGETILTLISDDNFNSFQQTLFMQFALPALPRGRAQR